MDEIQQNEARRRGKETSQGIVAGSVPETVNQSSFTVGLPSNLRESRVIE